MNFGNAIYRARGSAGLTQLELSKRLKITSTYISHLENNKCTPSILLLKKICNICGLTENGIYMMAWEDEQL